MFTTNGFVKTLLWGGVATAILTGCNQSTSTTEISTQNDTSVVADSDIKQVAITAIVTGCCRRIRG